MGKKRAKTKKQTKLIHIRIEENKINKIILVMEAANIYV